MVFDEGSAFQATVRMDGCIRIVDAGGELDLAGRGALAEACRAGAGIDVVVDMTNLRFMDCGGYGGLVVARTGAEALGGSLNWRGALAQPARLLDLIEQIDCESSLQ